MAEIKQIKVGSTTYDIVDANAQPKLVSGTNIKTLNGVSVLGSGNLEFATLSDIQAAIGNAIADSY